MSLILATKSSDRHRFVDLVMDRLWTSVPEGPVLVKPNLVSAESYPTTTHPDLLDAVLTRLADRELMVADAPAADLIRPGKACRDHPLTRVCRDHGLDFIDLYERPMHKRKAQHGPELEMSDLPFEASAILSLPVLKSHGIAGMTGALKNNFGFLSRKQRGLVHLGRADLHEAIAALNLLAPVTLFIVDAVQTLTSTNEVRHGGKPAELGILFAGSDPVALDAFGLTLLAEVEPKLSGKAPADLAYLRHAALWGVGSMEYEVDWVQPDA